MNYKNKYKDWIINNDYSQLRNKLNQLKIGDKKCFVERKMQNLKIERSLTTSNLLNTIPRSKTSLVTGSPGTGKSTLAASIVEQWANSKLNQFDLVLFLNSQNDRKVLTKLVWGEFSRKIIGDTKIVYKELEKMKDKILIIIDGIGKNIFL